MFNDTISTKEVSNSSFSDIVLESEDLNVLTTISILFLVLLLFLLSLESKHSSSELGFDLDWFLNTFKDDWAESVDLVYYFKSNLSGLACENSTLSVAVEKFWTSIWAQVNVGSEDFVNSHAYLLGHPFLSFSFTKGSWD